MGIGNWKLGKWDLSLPVVLGPFACLPFMLAAAARRSVRFLVPSRRFPLDIPQAIAVPAKTGVLFMPDHWQARKWSDAQRLPAGILAAAVGTIPDFDPGHTFVVNELVRAGITLYSTQKIPTAKAYIEKK